MAPPPLTVVLVDDAADVRLLARVQLTEGERFVVVAEGSDGQEAIALAGRHRPDILLLDVSMPRMDGLEALPGIRSAAPETVVIMYTGFAEAGLADRARELGAAGLVEKSTPLDELPDVLTGIVEHARTVGPAGSSALPDGQPPGLAPAATARLVGGLPPALEQHLERFREVFEEAAIGMATMTLTGQIVRANRALAALVDRPARDLVSSSYEALGAAGTSSAIREALRQAQVGAGHVVRIEHQVGAAGEMRQVSATISAVVDAQGRPLYLFLQAQDVSAQRTAEHALEQSEERFRILVEGVKDYAILMLDPHGYIESWNTGAERINGYRAEEIIGRHFRVFYPQEKQRIEHPEHELELALRDGQYEEEGWRIRKDGSRFWASVLITAVRDHEGRHVGFAKVTRNIDERRRAQRQREQAAERLAEANTSLSSANQRLVEEAAGRAQQLAVTAHELRAPINVLTGSAGLLAERWSELSEPERRDLLQSMNSSGERLQRLLADLLTAARLEANAIELEPVELDLADLLARTVARARATDRDTEITVDCPPGLRVHGDPGRLGQIVENLLSNASRHGRPPVRVQARRHGDCVEVAVSDRGDGVPVELEPQLFGRFATRHGGNGLGLFIVRELAHAHGGEVRYERDPAGGARFVVSLPG